MPLLSLLTISAAPSLVWTTILRMVYCSCFITCVPASTIILRVADGGSCWKFTWARSHFLKTLPWFPFSKEKEYTSLGWPTSPFPLRPPALCSALCPGCCRCLHHSPQESAWLLPLSFAQVKLPWWPYLKLQPTLPPPSRHSWSSPRRSSFHLVTNSITYLFVMLMAVVYFCKGSSLFVHWCLPSKRLEQCLAHAGTLETDEWWRVHRVTGVHSDRWQASEGGTDNFCVQAWPPWTSSRRS